MPTNNHRLCMFCWLMRRHDKRNTTVPWTTYIRDTYHSLGPYVFMAYVLVAFVVVYLLAHMSVAVFLR